LIELTPEQRKALQQHGEPLRVVDPATHDTYVLVRSEDYGRLAGGTRPLPADPPAEIPLLFRRSQEAFWRDLPELLKSRRTRGKWVAYHGDERIGLAMGSQALIRECLRRGLRDNDYYLDVIEPMHEPPWHHLEVVHHGLAEVHEDSPPPSP
jgi:hypothetical protein